MEGNNKACSEIERAAEQGNAKEQYSLGYMHERGLSFPKDLKKAIEWYQKAAAQGHAGAQNNLQRLKGI